MDFREEGKWKRFLARHVQYSGDISSLFAKLKRAMVG